MVLKVYKVPKAIPANPALQGLKEKLAPQVQKEAEDSTDLQDLSVRAVKMELPDYLENEGHQ